LYRKHFQETLAMTDTTLLFRRRFLKQMTAAGLACGVGTLGIAGQAVAAQSHGDETGGRSYEWFTPEYEKLFMEVSDILTGCSDLDTSLVPVFIENIADKKSLRELLTRFKALPLPRNLERLKPLLCQCHLMAVAKVITQLWYTGTVQITAAENKLYPFAAYRPVSGTAYLEGIAWDAMRAHPQGQCGNGEYGYWSAPPACANS
jgi:hypothetical protein